MRLEKDYTLSGDSGTLVVSRDGSIKEFLYGTPREDCLFYAGKAQIVWDRYLGWAADLTPREGVYGELRIKVVTFLRDLEKIKRNPVTPRQPEPFDGRLEPQSYYRPGERAETAMALMWEGKL